MLAVCVNGSAREVEAFRKSRHLAGLPMEAPGSRIAALYGVESVPTTLIIDRAGKIVARWQGAREDALRKGLAAAGMDVAAARTVR